LENFKDESGKLKAQGRVIGSQLSVTREIGANDLDQAWCRGNLSCHNDMHSQL
jgi:hypothetical protein